VGADIPTWGKDVLSVDAIYSHVRDSVALALAPGSNNAFGMPIPPFLPQTLTATISDNTAAMFVAKYTTGPLKAYAGYEYFRFTAPSDPQTGFSDIAGSFLCLDCQAITTRISTIRPLARTALVTGSYRSCGPARNTPSRMTWM
jgi:hypothetical protein